MSVAEFTPSRRSPQGGVATPAAFGAVRVGPDFADEYPDGDLAVSAAPWTVIRASQALYDEIDSAMQAWIGVTSTAAVTKT